MVSILPRNQGEDLVGGHGSLKAERRGRSAATLCSLSISLTAAGHLKAASVFPFFAGAFGLDFLTLHPGALEGSAGSSKGTRVGFLLLSMIGFLPPLSWQGVGHKTAQCQGRGVDMGKTSDNLNEFLIDLTGEKVMCRSCGRLCKYLILPGFVQFWCATRSCKNSGDVRLHSDGTWRIYAYEELWHQGMLSEIVPKLLALIETGHRVQRYSRSAGRMAP